MDFSLNEEQRHWQSEARKFSDEELRPRSLERDQIEGGFAPWDWGIIEKGSRLGFRTLAVPKDWGGPGADFVSQALVMAELARGDSAMSKAFSQNWKWSHLIASACTHDQKERFLKPFLADHRYVMGRGITEPNAGSDNRMPPEDDPKAGYRLRAVRDGNDWILNGEKCFIANGSVGSLFFVDARTNPDVGIKQGGTLFLVPKSTPGFRIGKVFNKRGWRFYQNAELIFENARVPHANVVGDVGTGSVKAGKGDTTGGDIFGDLELAANALGVCDDACQMATGFSKTHKRAGKIPHGAPAGAAEDQRDARVDRGVALVRDAGRLAARPQGALRQRRPGDELVDRRHPARHAPEHGDPRCRRLHDECARGQIGARRDGVDAPRRRHGAAGQGLEAPRQGVAGDGGRQRRLTRTG